MKGQSKNNKLLTIVAFMFSITLMGCDDLEKQGVTPEPDEAKIVRDIYVHKIEHPATWYESDQRTTVTKIATNYEDELYVFLISTWGEKRWQFLGRTEANSVYRDYSRTFSRPFLIKGMLLQKLSIGTGTFCVGGVDYEDLYKTDSDIDAFSASPDPSISPKIDFRNYRTLFTSITRAHFLGWDLIDDYKFYVSGNGFDDEGIVHPFVTTYNVNRWNNYDSLTTLKFFEDQVGVEFVNILFSYENGLYVAGYDDVTDEVVVVRYKFEDKNGNYKHEAEDDFTQVWEKRIKNITIDTDLANFFRLSDKVLISGSTQTDKGDQAGKLVALSLEDGSLLWDKVFDFSDDQDGFLGVTQSGANLFAYGYSNRVMSGEHIEASNGWALKLTPDGEPLSNYIYAEDGATIEITAAEGGYEQSYWSEYGYLVIGGSKKTASQWEAFGTQFYHRYFDD